MNNSIQLVTPNSNLIANPGTRQQYDLRWLNYFDPERAVEDVIAHVMSLPSSKTPEKHTLRAYTSGLKKFLEWGYSLISNNENPTGAITHPLPDKTLIKRFIGYLKMTGKSSRTVNSKYLAPIKLYVRALCEQNNNMPEDSDELMRWILCKEHMRSVDTVKAPRNERTTNLSPLYAHGKRFSLQQANATLRQIDRTNLLGMRDYAIILLGFNTGLRRSELARVKLSNFVQEDDCYLIKDLRGKRNNYDPIPVSPDVVQAIRQYVAAFNADPRIIDDERRLITDKTPLWRPLTRSGRPEPDCQKIRGIRPQAILRIVNRRTLPATGIKLSAHDLRRTFTAIAEESGMERKDIRRVTRHKSVSMVDHYIGDGKPDWKSSVLGYRVKLG